MHVYLIGYRGSGKSTVGRLLATQLGVPHMDSDDLIESQAGQTIKEIFAIEGEAGFRDRESRVIEELARAGRSSTKIDAVVSLGGGAILRESNRDQLRSSGKCVWLTARPEVLFDRIKRDVTTASRRPALSALSDFDEVVKMTAAREPLYRELSEKSVDVEQQSAESIAGELARTIRATGSI